MFSTFDGQTKCNNVLNLNSQNLSDISQMAFFFFNILNPSNSNYKKNIKCTSEFEKKACKVFDVH